MMIQKKTDNNMTCLVLFSVILLMMIVSSLGSSSSITAFVNKRGGGGGGGGGEAGGGGDNTNNEERPIAIVTGGTRGIGAGIATALAREGYDLLLTYNRNLEAAEVFCEKLRQKYPDCNIVISGGDMTVPKTRDDLFDKLDQELLSSPTSSSSGNNRRKLHILVHNAGQLVGISSANSEGLEADNIIFGDGSLLNSEEDEGKEAVNLDTIRYYQRLYGEAWIDLCERFVSRMDETDVEGGGGGTIIGISSPSVNPSLYKPDRTYSGPGSGKCIMEFTMRIYAKVLAPRNINVNIVVPGVVQTQEWDKNEKYRDSSEESTRDMLKRLVEKLVPMKRMMHPIDIGNTVAFLCSPQGRFITGMTLPVDCGLHIN